MKGLHLSFNLFMTVLLLSGCAASVNQGKFVRDGRVENQIETATVLPDHTYYYTGPEAGPDAIIAIDNSFTLKSKYWIKVDDVAEKLEWWNWLIDNDHRYRLAYEGYRILTPEGKQAGIWYSKYDYSVVQFPDPSTIILYTPIDTEQQFKTFVPIFWDH